MVVQDHVIDITKSGSGYYRDKPTIKENNNNIHRGQFITSLNKDLVLRTYIDKKEIKKLNIKTRIIIGKIFKDDNNKTLEHGLNILKCASVNLNLPTHAKEFAFKIFKKLFHNSLLKGRTINGILASCIYLSCRIQKVPITMDDIGSQFNINKKTLYANYKLIVKKLNLKVPRTDITTFVPKYISELGLSQEIENGVIKILNKVSADGNKPLGLIGGAIYLVCKTKYGKIVRNGSSWTQKKLADKLNTTDTTIRSQAMFIQKSLNIYKPKNKKPEKPEEIITKINEFRGLNQKELMSFLREHEVEIKGLYSELKSYLKVSNAIINKYDIKISSSTIGRLIRFGMDFWDYRTKKLEKLVVVN